MKEDKVLINFPITISMKNRFDKLCKMRGITKASVLNSLIEDHLISQTSKMEHIVDCFDSINHPINNRSKVLRFKEFIKADSG